MGMNPQQQEAVDTLHGPLMILAGAGSGKTLVIIHRIANLIRHGIDPSSILAVTFTNKAAAEMRSRVAGLLDATQAEAMTVSTFHSFCLMVLRRFIHRLGYSKKFSIATEGYQRGLIREIVSENGMNGSGCDPGLWLSLISKAKGNLETPDDIRKRGYQRAADIARTYEIYQERLRQMDLVDFDDLLGLVVQLWQKCPDVLDLYRKTYQYILIDEYQDTNSVQFNLMRMLAGETRNICVVGDDDQSIYGWRGANIENILDFETYFPGAKVIRLEQNYRSTNSILQAANGVIAHNSRRHAKSLWSAQEQGDILHAVLCSNEQEEAEFLCNCIQDLSRGSNWKDYAILFRAGSQSRVLEEVFHRRRVPYVLVGSDSFYRRKEILDALAFMKVAVNPKDDVAMLQIINTPPRGIGSVTIEKLRQLRTATGLSIFDLLKYDGFTSAVSPDIAASTAALYDAIRHAQQAVEESESQIIFPIVQRLLDETGYVNGLAKMYKPLEDAMKRRDNVLEFLTSLSQYDTDRHNTGSLQDFLEHIELQDAQDRVSGDKGKNDDAVTMMTIHASKGLEFPCVFIVGCEQGLFPHQNAIDEGNLEEERRLCYVAITRAKKKLFLTYVERRRVMNQICAKRPSKFLEEIPEDLVEYTTPSKVIKPATKEEASSYMANLKNLFNDL